MQFDRTLKQTLQKIRHMDPHHRPVHLSKVHLADGFCQFGLALSGISELGITFPTCRDKEQLIAFPLVLLMGWVESPPAFCAGTETIADLANAQNDRSLLKHPLEDAALTPPLAPPSPPSPTANIVAKEELLSPLPLGYCSQLTPKRSRI